MSTAMGSRGDFNIHINTITLHECVALPTSSAPGYLSLSLSKGEEKMNTRLFCVCKTYTCVVHRIMELCSICGQGRSLANFVVVPTRWRRKKSQELRREQRARSWVRTMTGGIRLYQVIDDDARPCYIDGWTGSCNCSEECTARPAKNNDFIGVVVDESIWTKRWTESMYA